MSILPRRHLPGLICLVILIAGDTPLIAASGLELARQLNETFVQVAETVTPAVVVVTVTQKTPTYVLEDLEDIPDDFLPPELRRRYRERFNETPRPRSTGQGSGTIIRENGYILSNRHVVEDAESIEVRLKDGRKFTATVRGTDAQSDVAVLKIEAEGLPAARWADSDKTRVGEFAIAIGAPYSLDYTVTFGHVSAKSRADVVPAYVGGAIMDQDFIQTDANINPGNSGGPLVNAMGDVIGVNSSIISGSGGSVGLGFAIPIDRARRVARDLQRDGSVRRAWVGLEVAAHEPNRWGRSRQIRVQRVAPGSPAAAAGVQPGMIIVSAGGRAVGSPLDWEARLLDVRVGETLDVVVQQGDRRGTMRVGTEDLPSLAAARVRALDELELVTLTPAIRSERRLASEQGALIIRAGDAAQRVGLRDGDLIVQLNRTPIRTAAEAATLLRRLEGTRTSMRAVVERQGQVLTLSFYIR